MVFLYFEILLPLSFQILQLNGIISYLASLVVVNSSLLFINKVCKYFLPFLEKYYSRNSLISGVIKIKKFSDDLNPLQIVKHDSKRIKKLLFGMSFIYLISALIYLFICWFLKRLQELINDIKLYKYVGTTNTTK